VEARNITGPELKIYANEFVKQSAISGLIAAIHVIIEAGFSSRQKQFVFPEKNMLSIWESLFYPV